MLLRRNRVRDRLIRIESEVPTYLQVPRAEEKRVPRQTCVVVTCKLKT